MESEEIDISVAAKASFAKYFMDTSFNWEKYKEQIQYSERLKQEVSEIFIGGEPPRDGDIHSW